MAEEYTGVKFKTMFEGVAFAYPKERKAVIDEIKKLARLNLLDKQNGNISVRVKDGMAITPAAKYLEEMAPEDMVLVKGVINNDIIRTVGKASPSSEARLHWLIYQSFPKVSAIVHFHDQKLLASRKFPETSEELPYGTLELAEEVINALKKSKKGLIIMKGHGAVVIGKDLGSCQKVIERVEKSKF